MAPAPKGRRGDLGAESRHGYMGDARSCPGIALCRMMQLGSSVDLATQSIVISVLPQVSSREGWGSAGAGAAGAGAAGARGGVLSPLLGPKPSPGTLITIPYWT